MADELNPSQARKLELEIEKIEIEIEKLKENKFFDKWLSKIIPVLPFLLGIAAFLFGVHQYNKQQEAALLQRQEAQAQQQKESEKAAEQREREILKPFLDKRTQLYFEASTAAATIAVTSDGKEREKALQKFEELYLGPMVIVEDTGVESAMVDFERCATKKMTCDELELKKKSLALASRMRGSIRDSLKVHLEDLDMKY